MINRLIRSGLIFILLVLLQVLLFNNIQFSGYVNPYVYIMFILLLPVETPSWLLLIISFFTGLIMDLFTGTPGMHTGATVFAGFIRPHTLGFLSPRDGYEANPNPSMYVYGFKWFFIYTLVIVLAHHIVLFYLEVFRLTDFLRTFLRVLLSSVFSIIFILLFEYIRKGK